MFRKFALKNKRTIRLSKSSLSFREQKAIEKVIKNEFLGMGNYVKQFEDSLTNFFKRDAVCVVNGTAALHLALQACGLKKGDEVLVQSITYLASFQAISALGAIPIACDVNLNSLTLDVKDARQKITSRTKAIMPVHYGGSVGEYDEIYELAKKFNLRVIEDAAHAFGTINKNQFVGSIGDIVCFSFDGIKNITSGEGGCIVSSDKKILERIKDLRLLGVINDSEARYSGKRSWEFDVKEQGWRYHMSDLMAAIGIIQLSKIKKFSQKRQKLAKRYDEILSKNPYISLFKKDYDKVVPHIYPILLNKDIKRQELQEFLIHKGIQTGIHYKPNHHLTYYKSKNKLPNTEAIHERILTLPLHYDLSLRDIKYISNSINNFFDLFKKDK